jgi:Outer membrane protein beta-barrel domain
MHHRVPASALLALSLLLCFSSPLLAQQRFSAGPRVGLNFSKLEGDAVTNSFRPGLTAGAFLMYSSLNHFGISADVLYSQRGAHYPNVGGPGGNPVDMRINYLEIPVALRYFLTLNGNFRPNLFFGPSLAIKLNANQSATTNGTTFTDDINSLVKPLELGILGGFQLNFPGFFGERQRFLVDARYTYGLTNILALPGSNLNNSTITVTLGYGFGVGPEYRSRFKSGAGSGKR